ncbi:hypothetical protein D3871_26300 [Noviherbaspirillum saxi]|uniref:Uncharacterized protein n=2 Tax=Noviherbaspirillum saxi TaxID=2320863 RepID=A0A3A3FGC9_9BURK|nr:hypothetical protein D3871_26300 [Noviherbaspirillum saxi]
MIMAFFLPLLAVVTVAATGTQIGLSIKSVKDNEAIAKKDANNQIKANVLNTYMERPGALIAALR